MPPSWINRWCTVAPRPGRHTRGDWGRSRLDGERGPWTPRPAAGRRPGPSWGKQRRPTGAGESRELGTPPRSELRPPRLGCSHRSPGGESVSPTAPHAGARLCARLQSTHKTPTPTSSRPAARRPGRVGLKQKPLGSGVQRATLTKLSGSDLVLKGVGKQEAGETRSGGRAAIAL